MFIRFPVWLLLLTLLSGCGPKLHKQQAYVFGTLVEITVYGEDEARAKRATDQVLRDFDLLHRTLHPWEPGALEQINGLLALAEPGRPARVPIPPGMLPIIEDASRLSLRSDGLFNPAIGNLVRLWGFHTDTFASRLPDPAEVARLVKAHPGMSDLRVEGTMLIGTNPAVRLDLGGYAKGYALDLAAATLRRMGVKHALINIGGNVMALGKKGNEAWRVGIQHPRRAGALAVLALNDGEAVGTSGDYQRFFEYGGKRYCHLIDPRTGRPADQAQAVTVVTRGAHAGVMSDVASKPLFVAGPGEWQRLAQKMGIQEALFIDAQGRIAVTRALQARLAWESPRAAVSVTP